MAAMTLPTRNELARVLAKARSVNPDFLSEAPRDNAGRSWFLPAYYDDLLVDVFEMARRCDGDCLLVALNAVDGEYLELRTAHISSDVDEAEGSVLVTDATRVGDILRILADGARMTVRVGSVDSVLLDDVSGADQASVRELVDA